MFPKFSWFRLAVLAGVASVAIFYVRRSPNVYTPVVQTTYGPLWGLEEKTGSGDVYNKYLGIRYAQPPVGPLRYESPKLPLPWTAVLDATSFGSECPQVDFLFGFQGMGDEDCLFLNVFTPKPRPDSDSTEELLPVLFFIHGGLFITGTGNMFDPEAFMEYSQRQRVVLVTTNYRLGSLGFLNTGDERVRGNMGLKDQAMALQWVQDNVARFGGDPKRVTIFGISAGAVSVHYHLLSDRSKNLFQKAISQSGTALVPWGLRADPKKQAERYAKQLGCGGGESLIDVDCLKRVPLSQIREAHSELKSTVLDPITLFAPSLEVVADSDTFISRHPLEIMRAGDQQRKPWILGFVSHEGQIGSTILLSDSSLWKKYDEGWDTAPDVTHAFWMERPSQAWMRAVRDFYFGRGQRLDETKLENFTNLATDLMFAHGTYRALDLQAVHSPMYPYFYTYRGQFGLINIFQGATKKQYPALVELLLFLGKTVARMWEWSPWYSTQAFDACHGDDGTLWFPNPFMGPRHRDYAFSRELARLWIQFANQNHEEQGKELSELKVAGGNSWRPWSPKHRKYLRLDREFEVIDPPFQDRHKFLDTLNNA